MLYEKTGRRLYDTERRIYDSDDILPFPRITVTDPSHSFRMTLNVSLTTTANPLLLFRMTPNGNHMLRLLTHSSQLIAFIFLSSFSLQQQILRSRFGWHLTVRYHSERGRKRIFILFFCVIPPSQYPPSGFAGHLLINKEAYPIPILSVRSPFLNTVANLLLALWMTPYRIPSFRAEVRMLYENEEKPKHNIEWRIYAPDNILPFPLITVTDPSHSFRMTLNVSLIMTSFPPIVILNGRKNTVWKSWKTEQWHRVKNLLPEWRLTVLYKDHGVGRQKELLAHVVRLRILACRNDLNRKRIVSLQLTAHS